MRLDISESDARDKFVEHLRNEGLDVTAEKLVVDGTRKWVTCLNRTGKNSKTQSGWYRLNFSYDVPSVIYSNYDTGIVKAVWHLDPRNLKKATPQEQRRQELERKKNRILKSRKERHIRTRQRIAAVWSRIEFNRAQPIKSINEIPYLLEKLKTDKGLSLFNTRKVTKQPIFAKSFHLLVSRAIKKAQSKGKKIDYEKPKYFKHGWFQNHHLRNTLITPYYNKDLKIVNVQTISSFPDKDNVGKFKYFKANLSSGQKEGAFCPINRLPTQNEKFFSFTEGYSTGQSFARISENKPCVVSTFDKNNILSVAIQLREKHPDANFYFAGDNDLKEQLKSNENGGVSKALEAANTIGGNVLIPPIKKDEAEYMSDWNDLEIKYGTEHCHNILSHQLHEIMDFKRNSPTQAKNAFSISPALAIRSPDLSTSKTAVALDPSIFTAWLLENLENKEKSNKDKGLINKDFTQASEILKVMASDQGNKLIPMMKYISQKNNWHDLNSAINMLSDKLDSKVKIERDTLNRVNFTFQALFYASSNFDSKIATNKELLKDKAELQLNNTIEYISYLPIERKDKIELYNNIKDGIFTTVGKSEPEWSKELLTICKKSIDYFEDRVLGINKNVRTLDNNTDFEPNRM